MRIEKLLIILGIIFMLISLVWNLFAQPYFESKTYNKLTGAHTTMWDAMWVELRVQEAPKKSNE